jgi:hypothetical protein
MLIFLPINIIGSLVIHLIIDKWLPRFLGTNKEGDSVKDPHIKITIILGFVERFFYLFLFIFDLYSGIMIWMGIKTAVGWKKWTNRDDRVFYNLFLIGNLVSIFISLVGWLILADYYKF